MAGGASPPAIPVHGVVSLVGICDLAEGVRRNLCGGACAEIVGGSPEEVPHRYQQASPIALFPLGVRQWHLVGLEDTLVPADYVKHCVAAAGTHDDVQLEMLAGAGHFEPIVPADPAWSAVRHAVLALLEKL